MYCKNCGSQIDDGASFCTFCGTPITKPAFSGSESQTAQQSDGENAFNNSFNTFDNGDGFNEGYIPPYTQPVNDYSAYNNGGFDGESEFKTRYSFGESITRYFKNYTNFSGRAVKTEYWYIVLFNLIVGLAAGTVAKLFHLPENFVTGAWSLVTLVPSLSLSFRRLHDTGRSGFYLLLSLIPFVGWILLIIYSLGDSVGDNEYGPAPRD